MLSFTKSWREIKKRQLIDYIRERQAKWIGRVMRADYTISLSLSLSLSLRLNGHFPDELGLAGTRTSPFCILLELMVMEVVNNNNSNRNEYY